MLSLLAILIFLITIVSCWIFRVAWLYAERLFNHDHRYNLGLEDELFLGCQYYGNKHYGSLPNLIQYKINLMARLLTGAIVISKLVAVLSRLSYKKRPGRYAGDYQSLEL